MQLNKTTSKFIYKNSQNQKIYYDRLGHKNTKVPCIYFLHGMGGDSSAWKDIRNLLVQKGYGSVAIDLRGHGWSDRPTEASEYAISNLADDVIEILKHENDQQIILVGHCLGGMVAIKVASSYSNLQGLVLVNSYYTYPRYARIVAKVPHLAKVFYLFGKLFSIKYDHQRPNYHEFSGSADISINRLISDIKHTSLKSYCFLLYQVLRVDFKHLLGKITIPVLALTGTNDSIFTPDNQQEMATHLSHSITKDIDRGNHVMVFDKGKEIVDALDVFIQNLKIRN